ncbi:hypothetical protein VU07_02920, partial [Desulfobulbus sp. F4]|nr:hypothetical protein [Desulfobulbus sp. F4]
MFSRYSKDIVLTESGITNDSNNRRVEGISRFRIAIQQIENTGAFKKELEDVKNINKTIFIAHDDSVALSKDISSKLISLSIQLHNKLNISATVLSAILPQQDQNSISIKLPKIHNLKELSNIFGKLDVIFEQLIVNDFVEGRVNLQNLDTGSEWLEVVFDSAKSIGVVVSVIYSVVRLQREYIRNKEFLEIARNKKITNDIYENLGRQLLEENKRLLEEQAKGIAAEAGADNEHEYIERVKYGIKELTDLIDKGLKFFPASISPSEIKSKLPDFTKNSIEEMLPEVKMLSEKTSEV